MDNKGGVKVSRFSFDNIWSHSAKIFRRVILSCCINFGYRKGLDERGQYQDFPSENICLTVPKIFVGELLNVALISGTEKTWIKGGGSIKIFRGKFFVSQCRKTS